MTTLSKPPSLFQVTVSVKFPSAWTRLRYVVSASSHTSLHTSEDNSSPEMVGDQLSCENQRPQKCPLADAA